MWVGPLICVGGVKDLLGWGLRFVWVGPLICVGGSTVKSNSYCMNLDASTVFIHTPNVHFVFSFLQETPSPTEQQVEDIFDGNICRCTGMYIR